MSMQCWSSLQSSLYFLTGIHEWLLASHRPVGTTPVLSFREPGAAYIIPCPCINMFEEGPLLGHGGFFGVLAEHQDICGARLSTSVLTDASSLMSTHRRRPGFQTARLSRHTGPNKTIRPRVSALPSCRGLRCPLTPPSPRAASWRNGGVSKLRPYD